MIFDVEALANDIKDTIAQTIEDTGHSASGRAIKSLESEVKGDDARVWGNFYIPYIEKGSNGRPPYDVIHEWAKTKGIISGDDKESRRISGAITTYIYQHGTKAYQEGGIDVWSGAIQELLDNQLEKYLTDL